MTQAVPAALALVAVSILPALALAPRVPLAVFLAPLLTGLIGALSGTLAAISSSSVIGWFVPLAVIANVLAIRHLRRAHPEPSVREAILPLLVLVALCSIPLVALERPPLDWDARSIWLFHARWFFAGDALLKGAFSNEAFLFSHADYPPLIPATVGVLWRAKGQIDLPFGQAMIAILNLGAVGVVASAFLAEGRKRPIAGLVLASIAMIGFFGIAGPSIANGYADVLWGAAAAGATLFLLALPRGRENVLVGLVCALVAGSTKNEGLLVAALVLALGAVRYRDMSRFSRSCAASVAVLAIWPLVARLLGAESDLVLAANIRALFTDPTRLGRIPQAASALWGLSWEIATVALVVTILGIIGLKEMRKHLNLGSSWWSWLVLVGAASALVGAYAISPYELEWHLMTSAGRTTIGLRLIAFSEVMVWAWSAVQFLPIGRSDLISSNSAPSRVTA